MDLDGTIEVVAGIYQFNVEPIDQALQFAPLDVGSRAD